MATEWVKGYQDENKPAETLSEDMQLITETDESAGHERVHSKVCYEEPYPGSGGMLIINGTWVTATTEIGSRKL